jgi:hypothetical protein
MRITLVTPFAEKDAVKALGARWDATKKCWYFTDVADLAPFARWIPDLRAAMAGSEATPPVKSRFALSTPASVTESKPTKPTNDKADCGGDVLPWEDCIHTAKP